MSNLHFGKASIKPSPRPAAGRVQSTCLIDTADYMACHQDGCANVYDVLEGIKADGTFLLNSPWSAEEMEEKLPVYVRRTIARKKLKFYNIDAVKIAGEVGLGGCINNIMQTAFFILANVVPVEEAIAYIKDQIKKMFGKKGDTIVNMNIEAVDKTLDNLVQIQYPAFWAETPEQPELGG